MNGQTQNKYIFVYISLYIEQNMVKWQPLSTDISKNMMVYRSLEVIIQLKPI